MKKTIIAVLLAVNAAASAATITVEGRGSDREAAKRDAFRTAIENVCGTMVLSDREHVNGTTTNDQVITHSSCNVEKYTVLEESNGYIKIAVEVQTNQVAQRLQSTAQNKHFVDQAGIAAQIETHNMEQRDANSLIDEVFRDYPSRAYNLKSSVVMSKDSFTVNYELAWNPAFLESLRDVVKTFSDYSVTGETFRGTRMSIDMYKMNWGFKPKIFYIRDDSKARKIASYLDPVIILRVATQTMDGKTFYNCWIPRSNTQLYGDLNLYAVTRSEGVRFPLQVPATNIYSIDVSVMPLKPGNLNSNCH